LNMVISLLMIQKKLKEIVWIVDTHGELETLFKYSQNGLR
jgi:hypothetical protein